MGFGKLAEVFHQHLSRVALPKFNLLYYKKTITKIYTLKLNEIIFQKKFS